MFFYFFKFKNSELFEYIKFKLFKLNSILWFLMVLNIIQIWKNIFFLDIEWFLKSWVDISSFKWHIFFIKVIACKKIALAFKSQSKIFFPPLSVHRELAHIYTGYSWDFFFFLHFRLYLAFPTLLFQYQGHDLAYRVKFISLIIETKMDFSKLIHQ